jgi:hypothetical protein
MNDTTDLARGRVNHNEIIVQLIRPADLPAAVRIIWRYRPPW